MFALKGFSFAWFPPLAPNLEKVFTLYLFHAGRLWVTVLVFIGTITTCLGSQRDSGLGTSENVGRLSPFSWCCDETPCLTANGRQGLLLPQGLRALAIMMEKSQPQELEQAAVDYSLCTL